MTRTKSTYLALLAVLLSPMAANADFILDASPDAIGSAADPFEAANTALGQNFATLFTIDAGFTLTGIDSYSVGGFGFVGQDVTIRIFNDAGGSVGGLFAEIASVISIIDADGSGASGMTRRFAAFHQYLNAGSYWIGVSGSSTELAQALSLGFPGPSTAVMSGSAFSGVTSGPAHIRVQAVPEPGTLALLGIGLLGMGAARRRKKA